MHLQVRMAELGSYCNEMKLESLFFILILKAQRGLLEFSRVRSCWLSMRFLLHLQTILIPLTSFCVVKFEMVMALTYSSSRMASKKKSLYHLGLLMCLLFYGEF
jgi:hypothetical protein